MQCIIYFRYTKYENGWGKIRHKNNNFVISQSIYIVNITIVGRGISRHLALATL